MKKQLATLLLVIFWMVTNSSPNTDSLLQVLDNELTLEPQYIQTKMDNISVLKERLKNSNLDIETQYLLYDSIFENYKSFHYDSSFYYLSQLQKISLQLNEPVKVASAKIKLGFIFLSSGMFKEAFDSLLTVNPKQLPDSFKPEYYSVMAILYYGLADLQDKYYAAIYERQANLFIDSVLMFTTKGSYTEFYYSGLRYVRSGQYKLGLEKLGALRENDNLNYHENAIISSTMSDIFINLGAEDKAIELLAEAAICDIKSATRETAAILNLANILYRQGHIKRAYTYTKRALDYANYYGARHRKIQVGSILPIIEEEKINAIESQKRRLLFYSLIVTVLIFIIILFIVITLRQLKKLRQADKALIETNHILMNTNENLSEVNKIKDEYIADFFNQNSEYIEKLENLQKWVHRMISAKQFDVLKKFPHHVNIDHEREVLYERFDKIFLKLFPNFVVDFNNLLVDEERIEVKENELLNTDLRIYALIRLGINDNEKIAHFLNYSVNTIYTYKTKIKGKSKSSLEQFNQKVMEIKPI